MTEQLTTVNFLKSKKIIVKGIYKVGKWGKLLANDITDSNMYPGVKRSFTVPFDSRKGGLITVFDNTTKYKVPQYSEPVTEQEFFERQLHLEKDGMNPYSPNCFWRKDPRARVTVPKEGITLNLESPLDFVRYAILKANKNTIAPSWQDRMKNPEYMFAICDEDVDTDSRIDEMKLQMTVMECFTRITKDKESMIAFLKVKGEVVPKQIKEEKLKSDIFNFSKEKPKEFVRLVDDPNFDEQVFLADAIRCGSIVKSKKNEFELNGVLIATTLSEMLAWLHNPENSKAKLKIQHQIENSK